jgi:hypothetical protein
MKSEPVSIQKVEEEEKKIDQESFIQKSTAGLRNLFNERRAKFDQSQNYQTL